MDDSSGDVVIVPAERHHLDSLCKIESQVSPFAWTRGEFEQSLDDHRCYVLLCNKKVRGYVIFVLILDEVELLNIAVAPNFQGEGLGRALLHFLIEDVKAFAAKIFLEVRASNIPAISLYKQHGFEQTGVRRAYYHAAHGREDALLMCRNLAPVGPSTPSV